MGNLSENKLIDEVKKLMVELNDQVRKYSDSYADATAIENMHIILGQALNIESLYAADLNRRYGLIIKNVDREYRKSMALRAQISIYINKMRDTIINFESDLITKGNKQKPKTNPKINLSETSEKKSYMGQKKLQARFNTYGELSVGGLSEEFNKMYGGDEEKEDVDLEEVEDNELKPEDIFSPEHLDEYNNAVMMGDPETVDRLREMYGLDYPDDVFFGGNDNFRPDVALVLYSSENCPACQRFFPQWNEFIKKALQDDVLKNIIIIKIDAVGYKKYNINEIDPNIHKKLEQAISKSSDNKNMPNNKSIEQAITDLHNSNNIRTIPTIILYANGKSHKYEGDRTIQSIMNFVKSKL